MQSKFSADSLPDLSGRVYLVTGGNAGIGKATVVGLASRGARVWMGTRNETKALTAIDEIKAQLPSANIQFLKINLSSLASVVSAAKELRGRETILHGLVNNAGVMGVPFAPTADGYDIQLQTNYIAHWLLTHHLLPLLMANSAAGVTCRIVNVTSDGHATFPPKSGIEFADINLGTKSAMMRYGQTKLANVLHVKELHRRYGPKNTADVSQRHIIVAAVHPGHIDTDLNKQATGAAPAFILHAMIPVMRCLGILDRQEKGALSSLYAIASDDFKTTDSGAYVVPYAKIGTPSAHAEDGALAGRLWDWTETEMGRKGLLDIS